MRTPEQEARLAWLPERQRDVFWKLYLHCSPDCLFDDAYKMFDCGIQIGAEQVRARWAAKCAAERGQVEQDEPRVPEYEAKAEVPE